jgi:hypothetical protein
MYSKQTNSSTFKAAKNVAVYSNLSKEESAPSKKSSEIGENQAKTA